MGQDKTTRIWKMIDEIRDKNGYEGNGWSKYQIMVLQQLEAHSDLLQKLNNEINAVKQQNAISDIISKTWKEAYEKEIIASRMQTEKTLIGIQESISKILDSDHGLVARVRALEENKRQTEHTSIKVKAVWSTVGAGVVTAITILIELIKFAVPKLLP